MLPRRTNVRVLVRRPGVFARAYWAPLVVLGLGAVADGVTTLMNVRAFGAAAEVHLVQRMVMEVMGADAGVPLAKVIQVGFVVGVAAWWRPWCAAVLGVCGVLYGAAAVSNYFLLL